ncbi:transcription factor 7-like 1-B isoform X1 [Xyrichtys novacula]|uniref:Transcription factor 7-like 1-B isoform X1 n=1 Tax=Xyrichtys novacula TaxID=13765 RepID=A0AAV1GCH0_XYRNO|nr:transcription factor 7-like 1-B isoform X1 [Xyrichtys novacula]
MDLVAEVDLAVGEMEWGEVISTLQSATKVLYGDINDTSSSPPPPPLPPPPPPPPSPAIEYPEVGFHPQPVGCLCKGYCGYFPTQCTLKGPGMAVPGLNWTGVADPGAYHGSGYNPNSMQSFNCNCQQKKEPPPYSKSPASYIPEEGADCHQSPPRPDDSGSVWSPPGAMNQELRYKRRKYGEGQKEPYVKKPLNAFMLFLKEERSKITVDRSIKAFAALCSSLGQKWKCLSDKEKAKYYRQAHKERRLHYLQHPYWSPSENYGKKRRIRGSPPSKTGGFASKPEVACQQCATLAEMRAPHAHTTVTLPVCNICHLIQVPHPGWLVSQTRTS